MFKNILILAGIGIVGYFGYKMYDNLRKEALNKITVNADDAKNILKAS